MTHSANSVPGKPAKPLTYAQHPAVDISQTHEETAPGSGLFYEQRGGSPRLLDKTGRHVAWVKFPDQPRDASQDPAPAGAGAERVRVFTPEEWEQHQQHQRTERELEQMKRDLAKLATEPLETS